MTEESEESLWTIFERRSLTHAVVVLNTPINFRDSHAARIVEIWNSALVRITVDGGTNKWLEWLTKTKISNAKFPHLITGDMDSIQPQTLKYFQSRPESKIVYTLDQNQTDFTKALMQLENYKTLNSLRIPHVLVLCDLSGRFDQTISNINTLYKAQNILTGSNVYLLSASSLTWLLKPGIEHRIRIPMNLREEKRCCGLLPIGGKCRVKTQGLKWNLNNQILEFGNMVSSSNTYDDSSDTVTILSDSNLTWTMEIDSYLSNEFCNTLCANKL